MPRRQDGHLSVLSALKARPEGLTVAELMAMLKRSERVVQRHLATLREQLSHEYIGNRKVWRLKNEAE